MGRPDALTRSVALRPVALRPVALRSVALRSVALGLTGLLVAGCTASVPVAVSPPVASHRPSAVTSVPRERPSPGPARQGTRASTQVDRYVPSILQLPGNVQAEVVPVATVGGQLKVPRPVDRLGWWDGSAWLGDPFGATVIAGHVDSDTSGLGFFAQLLGIQRGQRVSVLGVKGQRQTYEVTSVRTIAQNALADDGRALDQTGRHRLVLITCAGAYTPGRGYASNLVVTAEQVVAQKM